MSTDAIVVAAERLVGLSWGDPACRTEYSRILAPWDPAPVAVQMASGQSSCGLVVCAILLIAEVDGLVRGWRGRTTCDPLRMPRSGQYDAVPYLETLAGQRSARRSVGHDAPRMAPGVWWLIGGSPALGGEAHVGMCVSEPDSDGWFATVEGGQVDPKNPRRGAEKCTAILRKKRRVSGVPGAWALDGRRLAYTCDAGALPTVGEGMPWAQIEVQP